MDPGFRSIPGYSGDQAYLLQNHDKRVIFVNPYEGDLALGRSEAARMLSGIQAG